MERVYEGVRRRAVAQFGEDRTVELESYSRTAAEQISDVDNAEADPELEPLKQD